MGCVFLFLLAEKAVEPSKEAATPTNTPFSTTVLSKVEHSDAEKHAKIIITSPSINLCLFFLNMNVLYLKMSLIEF